MTAFTSAVRAVLAEADIDGLPDPVNIRPGDPGVDVDVQVSSGAFDPWSALIRDAGEVAEFSIVTGQRVQVTRLELRGTVGGYRVLLSAVRVGRIDEPPPRDIPTGTEYDLYADKDRGTALAAQHIAEMKAAAFGGGER